MTAGARMSLHFSVGQISLNPCYLYQSQSGEWIHFTCFYPLNIQGCSFSVVNVCQEITNSGGHIAIDGLLLGSQNPLGCGPSLPVMTECHEVAKIILLRLQAVIVIVWILIQMADTDKDILVLLVSQLAEP